MILLVYLYAMKGLIILNIPIINTIYYNMPTTIRSYVIPNQDGSYAIVLNSKLSHEQNVKSYNHEIEHILNGDYEKKCDVDIIEFNAHIDRRNAI